jgi:protein TonB
MKTIFSISVLLLVVFGYGQSQISEKINASIQNSKKEKFDSVAKILNYKPGEKIKVLTQFTIDEEGNVVDIKARGAHPVFEEEALRILKELPKMPPIIRDGKAVSQTFGLPINFIVESEKQKKRRLKKEKKKKMKEL